MSFSLWWSERITIFIRFKLSTPDESWCRREGEHSLTHMIQKRQTQRFQIISAYITSKKTNLGKVFQLRLNFHQQCDLNLSFLPLQLIAENQDRLYLVLIISVTTGIVLCLIIVVCRVIFTRRKPGDGNSEQGKVGGQFKTSNTGETTITNGFSTDDISEIDADIDLTTPLPMSTNANITRNDVRWDLDCCLCKHMRKLSKLIKFVMKIVCERQRFLPLNPLSNLSIKVF